MMTNCNELLHVPFGINLFVGIKLTAKSKKTVPQKYSKSTTKRKKQCVENVQMQHYKHQIIISELIIASLTRNSEQVLIIYLIFYFNFEHVTTSW